MRKSMVVFLDMDGTLVDSEPHWFAAEKVLAAEVGFEWLPAHALPLVGGPMANTTGGLRRVAGVAGSDAEIAGRLLELMSTAAHEDGVHWFPGAQDLLLTLKEKGVLCILVTTSPRRLARVVLDECPPGTIAASVTGDEVTNCKPDPEPYLRALALARERLGENTELCAVTVEDSVSGVLAARAAGIGVVNVAGLAPVPAYPGVPRVQSINEVDLDLLATTCRRVAS